MEKSAPPAPLVHKQKPRLWESIPRPRLLPCLSAAAPGVALACSGDAKHLAVTVRRAIWMPSSLSRAASCWSLCAAPGDSEAISCSSLWRIWSKPAASACGCPPALWTNSDLSGNTPHLHSKNLPLTARLTVDSCRESASAISRLPIAARWPGPQWKKSACTIKIYLTTRCSVLFR